MVAPSTLFTLDCLPCWDLPSRRHPAAPIMVDGRGLDMAPPPTPQPGRHRHRLLPHRRKVIASSYPWRKAAEEHPEAKRVDLGGHGGGWGPRWLGGKCWLMGLIGQNNKDMTLRFSMAELRLLTFKVEHILEELRWEAHHNKALIDGHRDRVGHNVYIPFVLPRSMKRKLKMITGQLNALGAEINGFISQVPVVMQNRIVGRVHEKQEIEQKLLCLDRNKHEGLKVLCVVGVGGVGKTALVQLIFDDVNVKEYFSLCLWVNVSRQFDVVRITKRIIEVATCEPLETRTDHMEEKELQPYLPNILHERRFLLVLDDVCDENTNGWKELRTSLASGASGSTVILTTRALCVARNLEAPAAGIIELGPMSDDEIWSIMRQRMLCGLDENLELIQVGQSLVQKCHGIPLATATLGDLLSKKETSNEWYSVIEAANEWLALAESDMLTTTAASVTLQMSYEHLPPDTKRCFALCALFPEAFEVDGDMMIQPWMANDMVWSNIYSYRKKPEDMGARILVGLQSRSFL